MLPNHHAKHVELVLQGVSDFVGLVVDLEVLDSLVALADLRVHVVFFLPQVVTRRLDLGIGGLLVVLSIGCLEVLVAGKHLVNDGPQKECLVVVQIQLLTHEGVLGLEIVSKDSALLAGLNLGLDGGHVVELREGGGVLADVIHWLGLVPLVFTVGALGLVLEHLLGQLLAESVQGCLVLLVLALGILRSLLLGVQVGQPVVLGVREEVNFILLLHGEVDIVHVFPAFFRVLALVLLGIRVRLDLAGPLQVVVDH